MENLIVMENGLIDLPTYNPRYDKRSYCYSYANKMFEPSAMDSKYRWSVVKYDVCERKEVAAWGDDMFAAQETQFVPKPDGAAEDDGLLLVVGYLMEQQETALYVVDAKSMETLQKYKLPFYLPMAFHSSYWPEAEF